MWANFRLDNNLKLCLPSKKYFFYFWFWLESSKYFNKKLRPKTSSLLRVFLREGFEKIKVQTRDIVPSSAIPPSELGTSLSEILLTVFFKFVELGLTDQFSSILVSKHLRRLGHSIWGVGPPPPLLGQCPKFVTFFFEAFPNIVNLSPSFSIN